MWKTKDAEPILGRKTWEMADSQQWYHLLTLIHSSVCPSTCHLFTYLSNTYGSLVYLKKKSCWSHTGLSSDCNFAMP